MRFLAVLAAALALGGSTVPVSGVAFLEQRQAVDGGIGERGSPADATSTAWGALALVAGDGSPDARARALDYLRAHEKDVRTDADAALQVLAREALGDRPEALLVRIRAYRPGTLVNATAWTVIALRQANERVSPALVAELRSRQQRSGGWSWTGRGAPDSNDTAAVVEALRAVGVKGAPITRALAFLARCRNPDGGYGLLPGRASDAQSTAWAIQAYIAAGSKPPNAAFRFLAKLRRPDGSYRYSKQYATTPVWVTSQVVPALARRPFPLPGG